MSAQSASSNVIMLGPDGQRHAATPEESNRMLTACRDIAVEQIASSMGDLMDQLDQALLALADKAEGAEERGIYLDARARASVKRQAVEREFRTRFVDSFNRKARAERATTGTSSGYGRLDLSHDSLSLVDDKVYEESIARTRMSDKLKSGCSDELSALGQRIGLLLRHEDLSEEDNPLSPAMIGDALHKACVEIESDVRVKLVVLQACEEHLSGKMQGIYHDINRYLADKEVLPNLRYSFKRSADAAPRPAQGPAKATEPAAQAPAPEQQTPQNPMELMAQLLAASQQAAAVGGAAAGAPGGAQAMANLTRLQQGDFSQTIGKDLNFSFNQVQDGNINFLRQLRASYIGESFGSMDVMTIDIVAMLFDYIFDDDEVPPVWKALIGRLQIPLLKVAMLDKSFFSRKLHPARQLVDKLAEASVGWVEGNDSGLYAKADALVQRVLSEFDDNLDLFDAVCAELDAFLALEEDRAQERAQMAAEDILRLERESMAAVRAEDEAKQSLIGLDVPEMIREFVMDVWTGHLTKAYIADGEGGEPWKVSRQIMMDLLWSVQPKASAEERMLLVGKLPGLLQRLEVGLDEVAANRVVREKFFAGLVHCHATAIRSGLKTAEAPKPTPVAQAAPAAPMAAAPVATPSPQVAAPVAAPVVDPMSWGAGPAPVAPAGPRQVADEVFNPLDDLMGGVAMPAHAQAKLAGLKRGSWVEFQRADGSTARNKLTWVSPLKETFLFTNRQGLNAIQVTRNDLVAMLEDGRARLMEGPALVDRAVDSMMDSLKQQLPAHTVH